MSNDDAIALSSNALQDLAQVFLDASAQAATRIMSNLRLEALRKEASLTERFWAYLEMGLDQQKVGELLEMRITAIAFTDRGDDAPEVQIGADMACFLRYDLPGLRWAKGFLGHSKLVSVKGWRDDQIPKIGMDSEEEYDRMIQQCAAMGNLTDESYVFFFSPESVTVEKASNLLGDLGELYPHKPWEDIHQFRTDAPVDIARFYSAVAGCQLGDTVLDKPIRDFGTIMDLVASRGIQTVLLLMIGTTVPQRPINRHSPELDLLTVPVPETYWLWPELLQTLINR